MTTDRIKEIQSKTSYPDSISVQQALLQVWNECEQEQFEDTVIEATQEQDTLLSRGLRKSLEDLDYTHKNIRMERILNTLFEKLDYINIDELEDFIEKL